MYRGNSVSFPCGQGGLNGSKNTSSIPITHLVIAKNLRFDGRTWTKAPGITAYDTAGITGAPDVLGAVEYTPVPGTHRIIAACSDGKVYRETSTNLDATTLVSGLTFTGPVTLLESGEEANGDDKRLLLFSDGVIPQVLTADGTSMAAVSGLSPDWTGTDYPLGAILHDNRVVAFMNNELYYSKSGDHTDFNGTSTTTPIVTVGPGFSDYIACTFSFLPQLQYVWKFPLGIYRVDTSSIGAVMPVEQVKNDIGGSGPKGVCRVKNDVWFVSASGHIHSLTAVNSSEDTKDSDITALLELETWVQDNVDLSRIKFVQMLYHEERQEVWVAYTSKSSTDDRNDLVLVIDVSDTNNLKPATTEFGSYFETLFLKHENDGSFQVYSAGIDGKVYKCNQDDCSIDGTTAYDSQFEYPDTDLGWVDSKLATMEKRWDWIEIKAIPTGNYDLTLSIFLDGVLSQTVTVGLGSDTAELGAFELGEDRLGGTGTVPHKVKIAGRSRRIAIRGSNNGLNQKFQIAEMLVSFKGGTIKGTK